MASTAENPSTPQAGAQEQAQARRRCTGTTKAGKPCDAPPRKDQDTCLAHADQLTRASAGFGGPENGAKGGRPRNPKAVEVFRERLEAGIDDWWQVLEDARTAERGVVVGDGTAARVEYVVDHPTRLKAFRELVDRAVGRPTQYHDVTTREEESEVDREIRELLAEMDSREQTPAHSNGNGNGHVS